MTNSAGAIGKHLCSLDDLPDRSLVKRSIGRKSFLVYRDGNEVFTVAHECPHHGQALEAGVVCDGSIVCPRHFARFDLRSGDVMSPPSMDGISSFEATVADGEVYVGRPKPQTLPAVGASSDERVIIVGGGAGGASCAEALRHNGFAGGVTLITAETSGPYDRTLLSKEYLAGSAEPGWLPLRDPDFYAAIGVDLVTDVTVERIDRPNRTVTGSDGIVRSYDALVVATGSEARTLRSIAGANVYTIRSFADADGLLGVLPKTRRVAVLGAGFVGLEAASALASRGIETTVVAPEAVLFESMLGHEIGTILKRLHEANGTLFRLGRFPTHLVDNGSAVELDDGSRVACDAIIVAVGAEPVTSLLASAGLCRRSSQIEVDERLRTADSRVYAIGDIASVPYSGLGVRFRSEHWTTAMNHGRAAAAVICGAPTVSLDIPFFWSDQAGVTVKGIGAQLGSPRRLIRGGEDENEILLGEFAHDGRLVGAAAVGFNESLMKAACALRAGEVVTEADFASF